MSFLNKHKKTEDFPRRRLRDSEVDSSSRSPDRRTDNTFRRNRTITGTKSDNVIASKAYKPDLDSHRTRAHNLANKRQKILYVLGVSLVTVVLAYWLLVQFTATPRVTSADLSISSKIKADLYTKSIDEYLGLHPLQRFRFALNKDDLVSYIASTMPEVNDIQSVNNDGIGITSYTLSFRKGIASWTLASKKYYVDSKGIAFENNYYGSSSVDIIDQSGIDVHSGVTIASNKFLGFVGKTVSMASQRGYTVTQAIIPVDTTRQLQIRIKDVTPLIKLSIDRSVGEQVEDMDRSIKYLSSKGINSSYIDVRLIGKAVYR